jgi:nicotinamide riboside kinase
MFGKYRIAFVGTHCSGKSTLVDALVQELDDYPIIKEVAARFPREKRQHLATQFDIMSAQIAEEMKNSFFISDRSVVDNIAYTTLNFQESINGKTDLDFVISRVKLFTMCLSLERDYLTTRPYDLIVFIDEMFPIEDNGNRCLNEGYQKWVFEFLKNEVALTGITYHIPVLDVTGSVEERVSAVLSFLTKLDARKLK